MTKFYCPTCKELKGVIIEGEMSLTLECKHTRPRAIPDQGKQENFIEPPAFSKWFRHHIDPAGLMASDEELKIVESELNGENLGV